MNLLNKTEQMAIEWLKAAKKYKQDEIFKNNKTPDFICSDGKRYEVKYLYANKLIFSEEQIKSLLPSDIILVFDNRGYLTEFLWHDKEKSPYKIIVPHYYEIKFYVSDEKKRKKLKEIFAHFGTGDKAADKIISAYDAGTLDTKFA